MLESRTPRCVASCSVQFLTTLFQNSPCELPRPPILDARRKPESARRRPARSVRANSGAATQKCARSGRARRHAHLDHGPHSCILFRALRRHGQVVRQRTANPPSPVRIRVPPPESPLPEPFSSATAVPQNVDRLIDILLCVMQFLASRPPRSWPPNGNSTRGCSDGLWLHATDWARCRSAVSCFGG